ncbi:hypothetical protein OsccyDRAFT_2392 [Leptolyngbyaceae cyanobacterium JSC-12]|nr:hypothetical protein OsccyDRAFT_2392 [Leptolyngbyaceae cyanobacterium JSC-12]
MNLPVVLDIAIGLVFIYLIASLLASEIQELISTILQWRAKHLRESIQNLLAGGYGTAKDEQLGGFIEAIYNDPLIENMNQSARGGIGALGQWLYRNIFYRGHSVFGRETTAPSYISSETFATALLERIGMETLIEKLTEIRLEKFVTRIIGLYEVHGEEGDRFITIPAEETFQDKDYREKGGIRVLAEKAKTLSHDAALGATASDLLNLSSNADFIALVEEYDDLLKDFRVGEAELETCVERMKEGLDIYINQISEKIATNDLALEASAGEVSSLSELEKQQLKYFKKRLISFKVGTFGEGTERAIASGKLKPTLLEIAQVFDRASMTYQEIEGAYKDIAAAYATGMMSQKIGLVVNAINQQLHSSKSIARSGKKSSLHQLPNTLTIGDLAEEQYQAELDEIVQSLPAEQRLIYKEWQTYQQAFAKIVRAIAEQLQSQGKLFDGEVEVVQPVSELNLETLRRCVTSSVKQLRQEDYRLVDQSVLAQLTPLDQQTYRGWRIYQQIILEVTRDVAYKLQEEERLFDYQTKTELRESLDALNDADLYQSVKYSLNLMSNEERQLRINAAARKLLTDQRQIYRNFQTYEQIQDLLAGVPLSVKQSLAILARRAQIKVEHTKDQLDQFNTEVSKWFDRSMSRASGVYKRNAKGVAIIIGFLIALVSNADTFHVVARLSGDDDLRQIITTRASGITQNAKSEELYSRQQLRELKQNTDAILQEISLPLRWTPENLSQQFNCRSATNQTSTATNGTTPLTPWKQFYATCLNEDAPERFDLIRISRIAFRPENMIDAGRMVLGWLVTGLAIAMGAPFWFDLMSKIMNVRNTGSKPAPATDKASSKT